MNWTCFSCSEESGPLSGLSSTLDKPRMEWSGVRNSWLTLATTRFFTSAARWRFSAFSSRAA